MAKFETITVTYSVSRCCSFQKAEVGASAVVTLEPGDRAEAVFAATMKRLAPLVDAEADAAVKDACHLASQGH